MFCSLTGPVIPTPKHDKVLNEPPRVHHAAQRRGGRGATSKPACRSGDCRLRQLGANCRHVEGCPEPQRVRGDGSARSTAANWAYARPAGKFAKAIERKPLDLA